MKIERSGDPEKHIQRMDEEIKSARSSGGTVKVLTDSKGRRITVVTHGEPVSVRAKAAPRGSVLEVFERERKHKYLK